MILSELEAVIGQRRGADPETSYTARLLADVELTQRKIMEEAFETVIELGRPADAVSRERIAEEAADLFYHLLVGLSGADVAIADVFAALERRRK